jgi:hypothetical protein
MSMEEMEPDRYLGPKRYRHTFQCERCGHFFKRTFSKVIVPTPPCPKRACIAADAREAAEKETENLRRMLAEQKPPGHIGVSIAGKAIDETARIVMEDHKLTDLKTNLRPGDIAAPSLPPEQQRAADNFFKAGAKASKIEEARAAMLKRRAISGAFRGMAVAPIQVTGGTQGEPVIRHVGTQKLG